MYELNNYVSRKLEALVPPFLFSILTLAACSLSPYFSMPIIRNNNTPKIYCCMLDFLQESLCVRIFSITPVHHLRACEQSLFHLMAKSCNLQPCCLLQHCCIHVTDSVNNIRISDISTQLCRHMCGGLNDFIEYRGFFVLIFFTIHHYHPRIS